MKGLTEADAAYIAGFMDGEGSIGVVHRPDGFFVLRVSVGSTVESVMLWLSSKLEQPYSTSTPRNAKHNPFHTLVLSGLRAKELLVAIEPYMIIKRLHAQIAITFPVWKDSSHRLTDEDRLNQAICCVRLSEINVRGVVVEEILNQQTPPKE